MTFRHIALAAIATGLFFSAAQPAWSDSPHTWVSGTGSDSNSGTVTSPYATFQQAINNTTAGGIISVVAPGDFGALTINRPITIDGGGLASINFTGTYGIFILVGATDAVTIRGLTINGGNTGQDGIFFSTGAHLTVENCVLTGFLNMGITVCTTSNQGLLVENTTIDGGALGIQTWQASGGTGSIDQVVLNNVRITNTTSAAIFSRNGRLQIAHSVLSHNAIALEADTGATINAASNYIAGNAIAFQIRTTSTLRLSNNDIFDNTVGIASAGGTIMTAGNNRRAGMGSSAPWPTAKFLVF